MLEPSEIKTIAKKYENENVKFRTFLKCRADRDELDKHFLELHNELFSNYDCGKCRNCCKAYSVAFTGDDVVQASAFLCLTTDEFIEKYLSPSVGGYEIKAPCCFLDTDGKCKIQDYKPAECRDFPYTNRPDRLGSLLGVLSFAEECPVVFEILQRLKQIYGFRTRK